MSGYGEQLQLDEMDPLQLITAASKAIAERDYVTAENAAGMPFQQIIAAHAIKFQQDPDWISAAKIIRAGITLSRQVVPLVYVAA